MRAAELRLGDLKVQYLANTAWAFATASQSDAQLFAALANMAELRPSNFNMQSLANTAWGFATASQSDAELFWIMFCPIETTLVVKKHGVFHGHGPEL